MNSEADCYLQSSTDVINMSSAVNFKYSANELNAQQAALGQTPFEDDQHTNKDLDQDLYS